MKLAITTVGSRGDLQPFIALAQGLKNTDYETLLISSKNDEAFARSFGIDYYALDVDIQKIMEEQEIQEMTKGDSPIKFIQSHLKGSKKMKQTMISVQEEIWQVCQDADAIIYHPGMPNSFFIAKEIGIPSILASPFPMTSTKEYPSILFYNGPRLGKLYNLLTHYIFEKAFWALSKSAIKEFWKRKSKFNIVTSAPPTKLQVLSGMPVIYGYSEQLFRRPKAWPENIQITGNWTIQNEPEWKASKELSDFINNGQAPVYIGFGSMKDISKFKEAFEIILETLEISKQRAIVGLGWNSLDWKDTLPEHVFLVDNVPFSWLFPQMAIVVHHGGAGTTAAGLAAGKPTVIIPFNGDQPAWGRRVYELGVGSKPIPRKKLTAAKLAGAIKYSLDEKIIANASALGKKIRIESGVASAVSIIDDFMNKKKRLT
jgi:sterol 3beta-glucosyltransferase